MMYLEDERHGPGQVDEVDLPMPHWQGPLAAAESLSHLRRGPHGEVAPADRLLVENVCEASHLEDGMIVMMSIGDKDDDISDNDDGNSANDDNDDGNGAHDDNNDDNSTNDDHYNGDNANDDGNKYHLVLLVDQQRLKGHDERAEDVAGGEPGRVHGPSL